MKACTTAGDPAVVAKGATMTVSGLDSIKVLTAALAAPTFTVKELAAEAGVSSSVVNNVLARGYKDFFECLGRDDQSGGRGAPPKRWTVRKNRLTDLFEIVRDVQHASSTPSVSTDEDEEDRRLSDASLGAAVRTLVDASQQNGPESATMLIDAARNDLVAAGFGRDGIPLPNAHADFQSIARARLIAATSDVLSARFAYDEDLLDSAQVKAFTALEETRATVVAADWLRLLGACQMIPAAVSVVVAPEPEYVLTAFQQDRGLIPDGILGEVTYGALKAASHDFGAVNLDYSMHGHAAAVF